MPTPEQSRLANIPRATDLPSPPVMALMVLECVGHPNWELTQLVSIIKQDSILTARLLEAAARTTPPVPIRTIEKAAVRVGRNAIAGIAMSAFVSQGTAFHEGPAGAWRETYWQRSVIESVTATTLAEAAGLNSGRYLLAGLMSNVGIFALLQTHAATYPAMLESAIGSHRKLLETEQRELGFTHIELSQHLMRSWKVDESIVDALADKSDSVVNLLTEFDLEPSRLRCACFIASCTAQLYAGVLEGNVLIVVESLTRKYFGCSFEKLLSNVAAELRRVGRAMNIDPDILTAPEVIYANAKNSFSNFLSSTGVLDKAAP